MQMVLTPYDLFSWKKETIIRIKNSAIMLQNLTWSEGCSLCLRRSSSITSDLIVPPHPSMLSLTLLDCLSFPLSGGLGSPLPPFQADPISLRPRATTHFHVGHMYIHTVYNLENMATPVITLPLYVCSGFNLTQVQWPFHCNIYVWKCSINVICQVIIIWFYTNSQHWPCKSRLNYTCTSFYSSFFTFLWHHSIIDKSELQNL
jgi:hypothetical protein